MTPLYKSPNGDSWFLARDPATGLAFVRHQANAPSGGQVTDIEIGAFLSGPRNPEHEALLRLIGTSILDPQAVGVTIVSSMLGAELMANAATAGADVLERVARAFKVLLPAIVSQESLSYFDEFLARESLRHSASPVAD